MPALILRISFVMHPHWAHYGWCESCWKDVDRFKSQEALPHRCVPQSQNRHGMTYVLQQWHTLFALMWTNVDQSTTAHYWLCVQDECNGLWSVFLLTIIMLLWDGKQTLISLHSALKFTETVNSSLASNISWSIQTFQDKMEGLSRVSHVQMLECKMELLRLYETCVCIWNDIWECRICTVSYVTYVST